MTLGRWQSRTSLRASRNFTGVVVLPDAICHQRTGNNGKIEKEGDPTYDKWFTMRFLVVGLIVIEARIQWHEARCT